MSQPAPEASTGSTTGSSTGTQRSTEQVAQERSMGAVSDVLLNIEGTLAHAKKARKLIDKDGLNANASLALGDAIRDLERVRKRLMQDTYFAVDDRLI
jgi:hypothetical protein